MDHDIIWFFSYTLIWTIPISAINDPFSDRTFGWHGRRTGLALYYIDEQHFQNENHELSLTSNMRSFFQIMATHTKLLGRHVSEILTHTV